MQFPVPQFTEVEDKIIGPLTLKQFGIIFAAGVFIFLGYSTTKSILVLVFFFILFGVPALGLAFAQINGRPLYNTIAYFIKFILSPKVLIFHKESQSSATNKSMKDVQIKSSTVPEDKKPVQDTMTNLREVQALLKKTEQEEGRIAKNIQ